MLRWRLLLGTLIVVVLVGLCWADHVARIPGVVLLPVAILATVLATGEILSLMAAEGVRPPGWVVYAGNLLMVLAGWLPVWTWYAAGGAWPSGGPMPDGAMTTAREGILLALAAGLMMAALGEMRGYQKRGSVTVNLGGATLAMAYVGLLLSFLVQLRLAFGVGALASLIIVVKMCDTGAYTVGRLIGRHRMAPVLSPGKTWEGAVGGLVFACLGAWIAFAWLVPAMAPECVPIQRGWGWLAFGLLVGLAGMVGDLVESMFKRDAGRKDSSKWMPGFGGILDILDSILLGAPVAYGCWAAGWVGY